MVKIFNRIIVLVLQEKSTGTIYIMMEARLPALFKSEEEYTILDKFVGSTLKGKRYKPIFDYYVHLKPEGAFQVLCDTYVTEESGTGIVHQVKLIKKYHGFGQALFVKQSV